MMITRKISVTDQLHNYSASVEFDTQNMYFIVLLLIHTYLTNNLLINNNYTVNETLHFTIMVESFQTTGYIVID